MQYTSQRTGCFAAALMTFLLLAGSAMAQGGDLKTAGPDITGEWHVVGSATRFRISAAGDTIYIEGWDSGTGEKYRISDPQWNGRRLSGIFVSPSSKRTTYANFVLADPDTLKGAGEVWKRYPPTRAPAAKAAAAQQKADAKQQPLPVPQASSTTTSARPASTSSTAPARSTTTSARPGSTTAAAPAPSTTTSQAAEAQPPELSPAAPAGPDITGEWQAVNSADRFRIFVDNGAITIQGWDSGSGEKYRISDVQWDGKYLRGIFVLPSSNRTVYGNFVLSDPDTFKGSGGARWKRQHMTGAPVPAAAGSSTTIPLKAESQSLQPAPFEPAGSDITGEWQVAGSNARFRISFPGGAIHIEGYDSGSGERYTISDVRWDGRRLNGIFILPASKRTSFPNLVLIDPDTLKDPDGEVWKRQRAAAAPVPAVRAVPPSDAGTSKGSGPDITGDWQAVNSGARFKITLIAGAVHIEGWDSGSGEKYRISDLQWDGRRLRGIFVLPSSRRTIYGNFVLADPDTLNGADGEVWKRQFSPPAAEAESAPQQNADAPVPNGPDISGVWEVVDSDAIFKITCTNGVIHIEGWDRIDGEQFRISNVQWDGKSLKGKFVMPSNNGTTYSNLLLVDPNTLKGEYGGDSSGTEVWKRR